MIENNNHHHHNYNYQPSKLPTINDEPTATEVAAVNLPLNNVNNKKRSIFFFNFKLDYPKQQNKQQQEQSSYLQLLKSQSNAIKNQLKSNKNNSFRDKTNTVAEIFQQNNNNNNNNTKIISSPSSSSKDSFNLFDDSGAISSGNGSQQIKNDDYNILRSRFNSPFFLRKTRSQVYKYNPFISSLGGGGDSSDQISRVSSTSTIRTDSGLSSVDSAQLLYAELKECLEKGDSYSTIEIKFRKNLYSFWSLDECGNSIFHLAAKHGTIDVLKSLVAKYPGKWYVTNKLGETAMQSAIDSGNLESFKYLLQLKLDENVDINQIVDHEGNSLLCKAIIYNQYEIVKYLIDYYPSLVNNKNCYGAYPLHLSAIKGNMQILRLISRESKKYINERDSKGLTPAMYASQHGHYECLKYLLDNANAKYNKTIKTNKYTLLHLGVRSGSLDVVQYLIMKMGASFLKCRTKEGATVYHLAAASGNHEILEYLLALKLAKNLKFIKDLVGSTAAHDAAEFGHFKCLKLLYDAGLSMFEEDMEHATPYSLALKCEDEQCKEFASSLKTPSISDTTHPDSSYNSDSNGNTNGNSSKFNLRRLSSMIRQRRAKPLSGTPPYLYTQKLRPAPVSLPQSSSITGIQNGVLNEDEFNDAAIDAILNQISNNDTLKKASVIHSHDDNSLDRFNNNNNQQKNSIETNTSASNNNNNENTITTRLSRYHEHQKQQQEQEQENNLKSNSIDTLGFKLKQSLSSSRESTPTLIRASRSGTPTPLLQSITNESNNEQNENNYNNNTTSIQTTATTTKSYNKNNNGSIDKPTSTLTTSTTQHKQMRLYKISTKRERNSSGKEDTKSIVEIEYNNKSNAWKLLNQKKSVAFEDEVKFLENGGRSRNYRSESLPSTKHNELLVANVQDTLNSNNDITQSEQQHRRFSSTVAVAAGSNNRQSMVSHHNSLKIRDSSNSSADDRVNYKKVIEPKKFNSKKNKNSATTSQSQIYEPVPDYWDSQDNINKTAATTEKFKIAPRAPAPPPPPPPPPPVVVRSTSNNEQQVQPISLGELISRNLSALNTISTNKKPDDTPPASNGIDVYNGNNLNKSTSSSSNSDNAKTVSTRLTTFEQIKETFASKASSSLSRQSQLFYESSKRSSESTATTTTNNAHHPDNSNNITKAFTYSTNIYVNVDNDENNIYSNNNENGNVYVTNVQVYNNRIDTAKRMIDIPTTTSSDEFPSPPTQSYAKIPATFDIEKDLRTPSPMWPPPPPLLPPQPPPSEQTINGNGLHISSESLIEARERILMKKNSLDNDTTKQQQQTNGTNNRTRISDSLLKEMQKHKLYNTQKDYILNYLDRSSSGSSSSNSSNTNLNNVNINNNHNKQNAVRIYNNNPITTIEQQNNNNENYVTVINTEIEKQPLVINPPITSYDRFPYVRNKQQQPQPINRLNLTKSIQFNETVSNNKVNDYHEQTASSLPASIVTKMNSNLNITVINNNNNNNGSGVSNDFTLAKKNNRNNKLIEQTNGYKQNNNSNESELDRVFKKRALQNQLSFD